MLAALENVAVVGRDARERQPTAGLTLTTRAAVTDPAAFRRDVEHVLRLIRRREREAEYLGVIEFTTGRGTRAGGARRLHQHALVKGLDGAAALGLEGDVRDLWHRRTGAHRVELRELRTPAGATAYLLAHHHKSEQAPPKGWNGRRLRASRGYFERPVEHLRAEAREVLREKRTAAAVRGLMAEWIEEDPELADAYDDAFADLLATRETADPPQLVRVARLPSGFDADGVPTALELQVVDVVHDDG